MKKFLWQFLLFSSLILFYTNCNATRLFINPTSGNNDTGDGSLSNPYKTLEKVGLVLFNTHCDTIYILGTFHNGVKDEFKRWDNQNYWIYIRPFNDTNVTLNGIGSIQTNSWRAILGIQSSKYIDIKNITVTGNDSASGFRVVSDDAPTRISQYVNIRKCRANNCFRQGILIQASDVLVDSCEIDSVVLRNRFQFLGNGGWEAALGTFLNPVHFSFFQNNNIIFRNNKIHNVWGEGIALVRTRNFVVENNVVKDCFSVGIYSDNSRYGKIRNNWISSSSDYYNRCDNGYCVPACGIFWAAEGLGGYAYDSIVRNIDIYNNLIIRTSSAFGWYYDPANTFHTNSYRNINIYYNTIFNTNSYQTFRMDTIIIDPQRILPDSCNFKNNIICKPKYQNQYQRYFTYSTDFADTNKWNVKKNCFIHGLDPRFPNNVPGAPTFVDSTASPHTQNSFKIQSTSNCKGQGIKIDSILTDYWNSSRLIPPCIGFHEYGGIPSGFNNISLEVPEKFSLSQNYPNPFNPMTKIKFGISPLPKNEILVTRFTVFDLLGREVAVLVNDYLQPGNYEVLFDGSNFASGIYFYTLQTGEFIESKRMLLIK